MKGKLRGRASALTSAQKKKREKRGREVKDVGISVGSLAGRDGIDPLILLKPQIQH